MRLDTWDTWEFYFFTVWVWNHHAETDSRCRHAVNPDATNGSASACILLVGALGLSGIESALAELVSVVREA